ncbi:MAG TPA: methionyl-tRNA formyltransferase [Acholeplasmatales bacterium]|nr:methionyl-tRNA formyltransferase [Clostridium sp. CAG:307]HCS25313.1 methionyl-tRNA formyltransferase [Acholeplasmatales bacterium]
MKIIFMGTPNFAVPSLEALNEKYEVVLVVSQPAKPEGRKGILKNPPVALKALELGIQLFQPEHIKNEYEYFKNIKADMIVTAAYGQFIPTKILNLYKKCINVHGSLLPHHRGGAPIQRAIINGDKKTGVTIMEMVKKMDAGRMYASSEIPILDSDNNSSLFEKLAIIGKNLLMENIEDIYNGKNEGIMQNEEEATISPNIAPEEEKINFNIDARKVFNLIRGLSDEPGAYCEYNGQRIKIYKASIEKNDSDASPGTIINIKKSLIVKCKTDAISILELQIPGKKRMNVKDFLNGQKLLNLNDIII